VIEELKVTPPDYAFPQPYLECMSHLRGLTMRDYFAAKAMQGLLASDVEYTMAHSVIAELAYKQADAMLEARK
jgi:hypothetical protein